MRGSTGCWRRPHERRDPSRRRGAARRPRCRARCAATSRSWRARSTASRSPTSTTPLRASSPQAVIDADRRATTSTTHANVHRGVHTLSQEATDAYEGARRRVQHFINARSPREIVFVRGTTEAINLVAQSCGRPRLRPGDEILIIAPGAPLEHRALADALRADGRAAAGRARSTTRGEVDFDGLRAPARPTARGSSRWRTSRTRSARSCPVQRIIAAAHAGAASPVLVDGAQAVPHMPVDVQALDCDFYCFSGHKMYGPTGIGVLYGREALLEAMPPWQGGGDMILAVTLREARSTTSCRTSSRPARRTSPAPSGSARPSTTSRRSASTRIAAHEHELLEYATDAL